MEHPVNRYTFEFVEGDETDARHGFPFNKEIRNLVIPDTVVP